MWKLTPLRMHIMPTLKLKIRLVQKLDTNNSFTDGYPDFQVIRFIPTRKYTSPMVGQLFIKYTVLIQPLVSSGVHTCNYAQNGEYKRVCKVCFNP